MASIASENVFPQVTGLSRKAGTEWPWLGPTAVVGSLVAILQSATKMYQGYLGYFAVCFFIFVVEHTYLVQPVLIFCSRGCKLCIEEGISTLNTRHADVSYVEIRVSPLNTYRFAPRFGLHLALVGLCGPISISRVWPGHELWFVRPIGLSSENGFISD